MVTHKHYVPKRAISAAVCDGGQQQGKVPRTADHLVDHNLHETTGYSFEESLLTVLGDYEEKPQHVSSEILPKTGCLSSSTENLCDHTSGKLQGFLF